MKQTIGCEQDHPLICDYLSSLRSAGTPAPEFRRLVRILTTLKVFEATHDLPLYTCPIITPLRRTTGPRLKNARVVLVPILRAGLGMVDGALDLLPEAPVYHVGIHRANQRRTVYYTPDQDPEGDLAIILDPMVATGETIVEAIELVHGHVKKIRVVSILASRQAVTDFKESGIELFTCGIDEEMNDMKYLIPGLGDAGDRLYS